MSDQVTLILRNQISELERVMDTVSQLCLRNSVAPQIEYDLNLALDEMVSNVIRHGFPASEEHHFAVEIGIEGREFVARIEDDGADFNPLDHPMPNLDAPLMERKEGGLGIYLVRQIMSSVEYQRVDEKNIVTMKKTLD